MTPVILYREFDTPPEELPAITSNFPATPSRTTIREGDLVIGRYSVLPYYAELCRDLGAIGAKLINSHAEHQYVADIGQWSRDLEGFTPNTWRQGTFGQMPEGAYVLKGQTNSKKFLWDTHMFASTKSEVGSVMSNLMDDTMIGQQTIYARSYIPLVTYLTGLHGLPITKEFRFFVLYGKIIGSGFYWSSHIDDIIRIAGDIPSPEEVPAKFLDDVIDAVGDNISFYVIDIAQAESGRWLVTDLNDGQMSGLSQVDPNQLYPNMRRVLRERGISI